MVNLGRPDWDETPRPEGFQARRARLGYALGAQRLGISLWELPPGEAAYPYHAHLVEEELAIVLEGRPSLRDPTGWRELEEGEVVWFPRGAAGGHQLANRTDAAVRFLAVSTNGEPDVVLYPDSGKVGAFERLPQGGGLRELFRVADAVDYWAGEEPPRP